MRIQATTPHEASKIILRILYTTDFNQSYKHHRYGYTFVYYSPRSAKFYFESQQRKNSDGLIKRYLTINSEDILTTTATKYSFTQITIGAIISRKIMSYREFFDIAREHPEWV